MADESNRKPAPPLQGANIPPTTAYPWEPKPAAVDAKTASEGVTIDAEFTESPPRQTATVTAIVRDESAKVIDAKVDSDACRPAATTSGVETAAKVGGFIITAGVLFEGGRALVRMLTSDKKPTAVAKKPTSKKSNPSARGVLMA